MTALPLRPELQGRSPYGAPQVPARHRLNTNENPHPLPDELLADLGAALGAAALELNRYPDRDAVALRTDLAAYLSRSGTAVTAAQVWAANGSNEILQQLSQAFVGAGRTALGFTPSYSMHPLITAATGGTFVDGHRRADFTIDVEAAVAQVRDLRPDLVFVTSPNNPTGTAVALETVTALHDAFDGMVVVDEAYAEFARPGTPSALTLLEGRPRLVVSRTMSKAFGMAGSGWATWPPTPPSSTRCSWSGCPTTCPASPRPPPAPRSRTPTRCWPPSTPSSTSATASSPRCPASG